MSDNGSKAEYAAESINKQSRREYVLSAKVFTLGTKSMLLINKGMIGVSLSA